MRRIAAWGAILALTVQTGPGEDLPPLPVWSPSDFEKVEKGEIIPGHDFFGIFGTNSGGKPPDLLEEKLPEPLPGESESVEFSTEISRAHLILYFKGIPTDVDGEPVHLIDPQDLLAQQEFRDRQSFLKYHAGESNIDLFVYLFDARQELPEDITIESVYRDLYSQRGPVAVVFYYLGMPERAQLVLSGAIRAVASEDEQSRALRASVQEAFEKSDPAYQLDNFLVELSIRLYWIEREMAGLHQPKAADGTAGAVAKTNVKGGDKTWGLVQAAAMWIGILLGAGGICWLVHYLVARRLRYVFPEVETGPLLGAPHAAGVGAVVSFSSAQIPPSQQRDQVPDYLQRM